MFHAALTSAAAGKGGTTSACQACDAGHLRAVLDGMKTGLFTFDDTLRVLFGNAGLEATLDLSPTLLARCAGVLELLEASSVLDPQAVEQVHEACLAAVATPDGELPAFVISPGERARTFALSIVRIDAGGWAATFEEITARRAAELHTLEQALHDPLTGLANRQLFSERVQAALEGEAASDADPAAVLMLVDLDRFKAVNDTLGHPIGDALLRLVGQRLRSVLRADDLVARLGGDEFAVLMAPGPDHAGLQKLGKRIVDVLGRPYMIDGHLVNVGASLGIALAPADGRTHDGLLRAADLALYHSKAAGRSTFSFFDPAMDARAHARRTMEIDLRRALTLREFELFYQPQVDLESGVAVGFEALVRWRHPERGLVSPAEFIPLAEEIGLIVPLGEWVLHAACREATRWPSHISVAVNVSPRQFEDGNRLADTIAKILAVTGLPGQRLEVEITESVLLRNESDVLATLHRLRAMGIRVAMDDFGTGYSSLSQLHSFPFDKIKIDRSFVSNDGDSSGQDAIIRAIAALGTTLGMATIAEGVETPDQLARIRSEGCKSVQGYLFSRPVPADQIDRLIADLTPHCAPALA